MSSPESPAPGHSRTSARLVIALIALHAALTAFLALARLASVHHRTFDLALYARLAWGLAHAQPWDPIVGGHFLGGHVPWVLAPLGLLGRLLSTVPVLLVAQSACVALAAWPVSVAAARRFGPLGAVAAALAFLLYPNLGHVATYEFHPGTLAVLPLACALEVLDRPAQRAAPRALLAYGLLVLACRVSLALQTVVLGALALLASPALRRAGLLLLFASLGYFALWVLYLQPAFGAGASVSADLHFGKWGGSPFGALAALLQAPDRVFEHLAAPARLSYLPRVLLPFALLPLAAPRYLAIALPPLALNLLSEFPTAPELYSHYLTPAVPALALAAVSGLHAVTLRVRAPSTRAAIALGLSLLLLASFAASVLAGGLPWSRDFDAAAYRGDPATSVRRAVLARIPAGASVQAPDPLLPHLAERRVVHRAPPPERNTRFVVLDVAHRTRYARSGTLLRTQQEPVVRRWLARPDHRVVFAERELIVLERGRSPRGGLVRRYFAGIAATDAGRALTACLAVRGAELTGKRLALELVARAACADDLAIRFGATDTPARVDLLFDGLLSPAHLARGDVLRSTHALTASERKAILRSGLYVGALRSSGARPRREDPRVVPVSVRLVK